MAKRPLSPTPAQPVDDTPSKLLDAAEKVFAEYGFEGASVRMINAEAQVDSGAIHYHFGNKQNLFRAVIKRRGEMLSNDRLERLVRCAEAPNAPPLVEQIVAAYVMPYINPALGSSEQRMRFARLRARLVAEQSASDPSPLGSDHKRTAQKFIEALSAALPQLSPHEIRMRYLIMWSSLNTLSASLGQAGLELTRSESTASAFEQNVPELIRLFAAMFAATSEKHQRSAKARSTT